ncbi:MAG: SRPBCC family protein [Haloechinothrix sp.]
MKHPQVSKIIEAPQRRVWAALTDLHAMEAVLSNVTKREVLTEGPFRVGTTWRESRKMFGKEATETMQVTEVHEPVAFSVCADNNGLRYRSTCELVARSSDSTEVTMRFSVDPLASASRWQRLLVVIWGPFGAKAAARQMRTDLDDIARHVQAG